MGTDPDNYICFGTTDKDACTGDYDTYMYRIIGIFEDGTENKHVKLIKKESLGLYKWHSDITKDTNWSKSDLYNGLNGDYFSNNTAYSYMQDSTWTDKIATWNYTMTDTKTSLSSGPNYQSTASRYVYLHELNRSEKSNLNGTWTNLSAKISLMYASDYVLSLGSEAFNYTSASNNDLLKNGWIHVSHNESDSSPSTDWTMTRANLATYYYAWVIFADGQLSNRATAAELGVRPVFYLTSDVEYTSGTGTLEDPFIIS